MSFYSFITHGIEAYTGLSPAAFFTILALMIGVYRLVSGMFVGPEELKPQERSFTPPEMPPVVEPVQLGEITEEELRAFDGSDPKKPLLMAIKGNIYDVSMSRMFYGPGGPYALFAGREASRALALMSFDPQDLNGNLDGLEPDELEVLQDWEYKFMEKYVKVGQLVSEKGKDGGSGDKTGQNLEPEGKIDEDLSQDTKKGDTKERNQEPKIAKEENLDQDSRNGGDREHGNTEPKEETETLVRDLKNVDETEGNQDHQPKREIEETLGPYSENGDETKEIGDPEHKRETEMLIQNPRIGDETKECQVQNGDETKEIGGPEPNSKTEIPIKDPEIGDETEACQDLKPKIETGNAQPKIEQQS